MGRGSVLTRLTAVPIPRTTIPVSPSRSKHCRYLADGTHELNYILRQPAGRTATIYIDINSGEYSALDFRHRGAQKIIKADTGLFRFRLYYIKPRWKPGLLPFRGSAQFQVRHMYNSASRYKSNQPK